MKTSLATLFAVLLFAGHLSEFAEFCERLRHVTEDLHNLLQGYAFTAELLCSFLIFPYPRVSQLPLYFFQTITLFRIVKDTPEARSPARPAL